MARAGDVIYLARQYANLSQSELAKRTGIPQSTISDYERYKVSPSYETTELLVARCGHTLTVRLEPLGRPRLPNEPWASDLEAVRDRLVNAVREHRLSQPAIAPPEGQRRKSLLVVTSHGSTTDGAITDLQKALKTRLRLDLDVVDRTLMDDRAFQRLALHAFPLTRPGAGSTWRETRFREKDRYEDDRWFGSVIEAVEANALRGSTSIWRWIRPPGSRAWRGNM